MKKSILETAFRFNVLRCPGDKRIIIRPSRGGRQPGRMYAVREDDSQRTLHYSRLSAAIIDRVLVRLSFPLLGSQCDEGIVFPEETHVRTVLAPNRHTVKLLKDYEKKISTMVTDKDPAVASRLEEVCFLGIQFGQASVRTSEVVRRGSSGGQRKPETVKKQKSAHDGFAIPVRRFFDVYQDHCKNAGLPFSQVVDGFRECIREFIPEWIATGDAELCAFATQLRGKAGIDSDGVMNGRHLDRHYLREDSTTN